MRESTIERQLTQWAKEMKIYTRKFVSPGHRGVPDRVFCGPVGLLFLELKAPGKKPEPIQELEIDLINKTKCLSVKAAWADNLNVAKALVTAACLGDSPVAEMTYCSHGVPHRYTCDDCEL